MKQYVDKDALAAWIESQIDSLERNSGCSGIFGEYQMAVYDKLLSFIDTLEVEEIETPEIPKHSYFEQIYHCGSEPRWKIGDVLAVYEFYSDHEGEHIYGKITDVKMDENEDWCYTFDNGDVLYENMLISDDAYKSNIYSGRY